VVNKAQPASIAPGYLANDAYFIGSLDGTLRAYNAENEEQFLNLKNPAPIISSLWVRGNSLYLGAGIPGLLGKWAGKGDHGLYACSIRE
jgi:polyvinyl alcohol dehydrogenase (cytochrome)